MPGKMGDWIRQILLSCCDREHHEEEEDEDSRPALQISGPTNFRREDITIPGLDPEQQRFIREKALTDATRMWTHLQPLRSSPSDHFATPDNKAPLPTYEQFTTPRPAPPSPQQHESPLERVKRHSRKISSSLRGSAGYSAVGSGSPKWEGGRFEMGGLMDSTGAEEARIAEGKVSGGSFSVSGSEREGVRDGDGGKGTRVKL